MAHFCRENKQTNLEAKCQKPGSGGGGWIEGRPKAALMVQHKAGRGPPSELGG